MPAGRIQIVTKSKKEKQLDTKIKRISTARAHKAIRRQAETKFFPNNTWAAGIASSATPGLGSLTDVPQTAGVSTDSTRIGDVINLTSFQFRYYVVGADSYNVIRVMFFQWNQDDTPTANDILADAANPLTSAYRRDTNNHYKIIYDKVHTPVLSTSNQVQHVNKFFSKNFKKKVKFDAGTTTAQNKIWLLHVSDSGAISHPTLYLQTQCNFTDL